VKASHDISGKNSHLSLGYGSFLWLFCSSFYQKPTKAEHLDYWTQHNISISKESKTNLKMSPASIQTDQDTDSDADVEFEDVPISLPNRPRNMEDTGIQITVPSTRQPQWSPTLSLPQQRSQPIPSGSDEEIQLRGQISTGIERVTYRKMKSDMGMDAPDTPVSERRYDSFKELAAEVEGLVDSLWASSTREFYILYFIHCRSGGCILLYTPYYLCYAFFFFFVSFSFPYMYILHSN
jgi:hypothetical protein